MSDGERERNRTVEYLEDEMGRLREQQIAAEKRAGLVGMTIEDSRQYKDRHHRIRRLMRKLAALDGKQEARHEHKETQEVARQSAEGG